MFYPIIFLLPGLILLAASVSASAHPGVSIAAFICAGFAMITARFRFLLAILALQAIALVILSGEAALPSAALTACGGLLLFMGGSFRCPRCLTLPRRDQPWRGGPKSDFCYICGRKRKRIWPLQYVFRPESWDGEYHDEGGGPPSPDSIVDWWRDQAFALWLKHNRHRR